MKNHRFKLASNKIKKGNCPKCGESKHWQYYFDTETQQPLNEQFGRCDNRQKCGHFVLPPLQTKCFFVPFLTIADHSTKAVKITTKKGIKLLPKSQLFETLQDGCYLNSFILDNWNNSEQPKPIYVESNYKYFSNGSEIVISQRPPQLQKVYNANLRSTGSVDYGLKLFTEVDPFHDNTGKKQNKTKDGILSYLTLTELQELLNGFKKGSGGKADNPAILKGIYQDGTSGEYCTTSVPFLFFDIDVKEQENPVLLDPSTNQNIFDYLQKLAVLVWRSNSQKGIAGLLYVSKLEEYTNESKEQHLTAAKTIYKKLTEMVEEATGIKVEFDNQQGKSRQIRYLAEQQEARTFNESFTTFEVIETILKPEHETEFIPVEVLEQTFTGYDNNVFIQNLLHNVPFPFTEPQLEEVISLYSIGTVTTGRYRGCATFPYIDEQKRVRAVQVKGFDNANSSTIHNTLPIILTADHEAKNEPLPEWLQRYEQNEKQFTCLFGTNLLSHYPTNPIILVEAPKTAFYGTLYEGHPKDPKNYLWLATYNLGTFSLDRCQALENRHIVVIPDLSKDGSSLENWTTKAHNFQQQIEGSKFTVLSVEQFATQQQKEKGKDIADLLIQQDWRTYKLLKGNPKLDALPKTVKTALTIEDLTASIIEPESQYSKAQVIQLICKFTKVCCERAEQGFSKMIKAKTIEPTLDPNLFYLSGSTPF
jgi:hypothetical protein